MRTEPWHQPIVCLNANWALHVVAGPLVAVAPWCVTEMQGLMAHVRHLILACALLWGRK